MQALSVLGDEMRWFQALLPREDRFFGYFIDHARLLLQGAEALRDLLVGGDGGPEACAAIMRYEDQADEVTRTVFLAVRRTFITPFDRGDIQDLIQFLHSVGGKPSDATSATRGAAIFAGRGGCWDCHAGDARGDPAIGAPNLIDSVWLYGDGSDKWIFQSIAQGRAGQCPGWSGRLSPVKIRELSLYVYSLSHGSAQPKPSLQ